MDFWNPYNALNELPLDEAATERVDNIIKKVTDLTEVQGDHFEDLFGRFEYMMTGERKGSDREWQEYSKNELLLDGKDFQKLREFMENDKR